MTFSERSEWNDDVLRVADEMTMHAVAGMHGWVAFSMADGTPLDHAAYPTWGEAVKAARWNRDNYMFLEIQPDGMPYNEARAVLEYFRGMSKMGYRIPSPDWEAGPLASSMPMQPADRKKMMRQLARGKPIYPDYVPYTNLPQYTEEK